ncbi:MAG: hypothetical protein JXB46_09780, partial [Candidatus Eisenbacteria bacterium]|nr:hypothetical protein [Candidatus Eisenbacteria bacterium]
TCIHCGEPLPHGSSRRRRYCSDACRVAAARRRQTGDLLRSPVPLGTEPAMLPASAHPDDQVAVAILEARAIASAFLRLGREARPQFAWRCEAVGIALAEALRRSFPELER